MTDLMIHLEGGDLSFAQATALARRVEELEASHWHFNDCKCCVTVHGHAEAYVINRQGDETMFPNRGCDCPEDH